MSSDPIPYYDCAPNHSVNHHTATLSLLEPAHRGQGAPHATMCQKAPITTSFGSPAALLSASLSKPPLLCLSQIAFPFPSSSVPDTIHLLRTENCLLGTPAFLPTIGASSTNILIVKDQLLGVFSGCLPCLCPGALGPWLAESPFWLATCPFTPCFSHHLFSTDLQMSHLWCMKCPYSLQFWLFYAPPTPSYRKPLTCFLTLSICLL